MNPLYNRAFCLIFLSQVGFVLANTLLTHYARWLKFLGGTVQDVGLIMGAGSVLGLLMRPWIGQLIDRFGARNTWLAGYALVAAGALSNLLLTELGNAVYVCRSLSILGAAFCFSSSLTLITRLAPPDRRTEAIGSLGIAGFLGMVLGPMSGDLILLQGRTREVYELMFVVGAAALVIPAILLLLVPNPAEHRRSSTGMGEFTHIVRRHWPGMTVVGVLAAFGLCMNVPFVFLADFVDRMRLETTIPAVTLFFLCYSSVGISIRTLGRRIPERIGRRKVLLAGTVFMSAGMMCFLIIDTDHPYLIILPAMTCGMGHAFIYHTCSSLFLESFADEVRGVGAAFSLMVLDTGMIGGGPLLGLIADHWGYHAMFPTIAGVTLTAGILYFVGSIPVWRARAGIKPTV
ncbi:MAG: MFS transporter [Planctomycetota bacterium]|nr:MFS transporter [Planctomycetota bacterium]